jgi:uncharacterized protein YbjT (DUF2867 family)
MYLVTGATGNVGREMVDQLLGSGEKVRVFTRMPAKQPLGAIALKSPWAISQNQKALHGRFLMWMPHF